MVAAAAALSSPASWAVTPFVLKDIRIEGLQRTDPGTVFENADGPVTTDFGAIARAYGENAYILWRWRSRLPKRGGGRHTVPWMAAVTRLPCRRLRRVGW